MGLRRLAVVPFIVALALGFAPSASADTYTDQVVAKFHAQTHVVADPAAKPPLQNPDAINEQILSRTWAWSSAPPVWVAAVAPNQTGVTTPDAIHDLILGRDPAFSGVILVIDAKGYHVRAYDVPRAIADRVDPILGRAAKDHHNDPYGATSEFVSKLSDVSVAADAPATTSPTTSAKHTNSTWLWVFLIAILALVVGLIWLPARNRKRRKDAEAREQIKQGLITAESDVSDLDNAMVTESEADVSAETLKANSSLGSARKAYQAGDYNAARAHLRVVRATVDKANKKLGISAVTSVPEEDRKQASVQARDPETGRQVTIDNTNYATTQQPGYQHYYGGGYHNGMFFYPGFYPYSFWGPGWGWSPVDVLMVDALLDDHWHGDYERGYEAGHDSAQADAGYDGGQYSGYDSQQGNFGFDSGYQDSSSGGGDVGFSGSDFGGGYDGGGSVDFGGFGGSDFGGGGFDSGGGNSGF
jgi:hypothetical protein